MADGRWVMTRDELNNVVCGFNEKASDSLPNCKQHRAVDNRDGKAAKVCAFCGSADLQAGFGGYGDGYGFLSSKCRECGGTTDYVYKDEVGKYFEKKSE